MKRPNMSALVIGAVLCVTPISLRCSHDTGISLSSAFNFAEAAELNLPVRHHRYRAYYSRLYNPYCDGPYTGGGFNGGTYYGGPWIDYRCFGGVY